MIIVKLFVSFILLCSLFIGVKKANKQNHNTQYHPLAEYMTGFIFTFGALWGLYALWS